MEKDLKKLFTYYKNEEPSSALFGIVVVSIKKEKEKREVKRFLFLFSLFFIVLASTLPFSVLKLASETKSSGILYFLSIAVTNLGNIASLWKDLSFAILESLPIIGILMVLADVALILTAIRFFLNKKKILTKYLNTKFSF